jgi:hypothetical protein
MALDPMLPVTCVVGCIVVDSARIPEGPSAL